MVDIPASSMTGQDDRTASIMQRLAQAMANKPTQPTQANSATPMGALGTAMGGAMQNAALGQIADQIAKQKAQEQLAQYFKLAQIGGAGAPTPPANFAGADVGGVGSSPY